MPRPEVTLENYEELYGYYAELDPSSLALKGLHAVASLSYHPSVHYAPDAQERISRLLDDNRSLILACNHIDRRDQFPIAAAARQEEALRPLVAHTSILAKKSYFESPVARWVMDAMGGIPVFRPQDIEKADRRTSVRAGRAMLNATIDRLGAGNHLLVFPEGTRNRENPTKLDKIHDGVGILATRAANVAIVPMALWPGEDTTHSLRPEIYINQPLEPPFDSAVKVTNALREAMKDSLTMARALGP